MPSVCCNIKMQWLSRFLLCTTSLFLFSGNCFKPVNIGLQCLKSFHLRQFVYAFLVIPRTNIQIRYTWFTYSTVYLNMNPVGKITCLFYTQRNAFFIKNKSNIFIIKEVCQVVIDKEVLQNFSKCVQLASAYVIIPDVSGSARAGFSFSRLLTWKPTEERRQ